MVFFLGGGEQHVYLVSQSGLEILVVLGQDTLLLLNDPCLDTTDPPWPPWPLLIPTSTPLAAAFFSFLSTKASMISVSALSPRLVVVPDSASF